MVKLLDNKTFTSSFTSRFTRKVKSILASDDITDTRRLGLQHWVFRYLEAQGYQNLEPLVPVSDDASFRRYFRVRHDQGSLVCVDAPPDKEDNESFVAVHGVLARGDVMVPELIHYDISQGFLLLSDLGDGLLLHRLERSSLEGQLAAYQTALACLGEVIGADPTSLPSYDQQRLTDEMKLFPEWLLDQQLRIPRFGQLSAVMDIMVENALAQPQVFVHRDFHARNLMPVGDELGVIDFQDAVSGPITYDLVSLLKDCYWRLPRRNVEGFVESFRKVHVPEVDAATFLRWFDLMGFQRHLKCAGIFSRLNLRDGKPGYLKDISLVVDYLLEVSHLYPELNDFGDWMQNHLKPRVVDLVDGGKIR